MLQENMYNTITLLGNPGRVVDNSPVDVCLCSASADRDLAGRPPRLAELGDGSSLPLCFNVMQSSIAISPPQYLVYAYTDKK